MVTSTSRSQQGDDVEMGCFMSNGANVKGLTETCGEEKRDIRVMASSEANDIIDTLQMTFLRPASRE